MYGCAARKPIAAHKTGGNMGEQGTRGLMTVGELASRVGVTVRTIQYYDQRGLLHPTCKGEQKSAPVLASRRGTPQPNHHLEVPGLFALANSGRRGKRLAGRIDGRTRAPRGRT